MSEYTQEQLVKDLVRIFPGFEREWAMDNEDVEYRANSLHSVYMSFLPYLSTLQPSNQQWKLLAAHLNEAVAAGGHRENAADTCFLEHLHQVKLNRLLRPLLSKEAKGLVRA